MKNLLLLLVLAGAFLFSSCKKDDTTTNPPATETNPIVGTWVAFGLRVAPFRIIKIVATFNSNNSYTVVQTDSSNTTTTLSGTYQMTKSNYTDTLSTSNTKGADIYSITANQTSPATVTATGIFAIDGNNMTYEVIQTDPALAGVSAPTAEGGFGSTTIAGVKYNIYVQKYVKQ